MTRAHPIIAVRRTSSAPARTERLGWLVLAVLACLLAHEASYQLMYRGGDSYRSAMTLLGHDGYWPGISIAVGISTLALLTVAVIQLRRLGREAAAIPALAADEMSGPMAYLRLMGGTWLRLALFAVLVFTGQENLEALAAGLPLRGIDVVVGHGLLPFLVILATTLLMSLAVALVRWRRRALLGRLAAAARPWTRASAHRRRSATHPAPGAVCTDRWGSRAPPRLVATTAL